MFIGQIQFFFGCSYLIDILARKIVAVAAYRINKELGRIPKRTRAWQEHHVPGSVSLVFPVPRII